MTRIDIELVNRNMLSTRSKAQMEIKNGIVFCNGKKVTKSSYEVNQNDKLEIRGEILKYVSRGGLKLEKALNEFHINLDNKTLLDIGSSTGGFTDCALQNNIKKVIDIDVGKNQLDAKLRNNKKVEVFENTDIREFNSEILKNVDIISIDISFISVTKIMDKLKKIEKAKEIICLIKPQFECGKENADKYKGVIKDKNIHKEVINNVVMSFSEIDYYLNGLTYSPIEGGNGNIEYLSYFTKSRQNININYDKLIKEAFNNFC